MDPFGHPDLQRLARTLRVRLDETLDAEQAAARASALRRRSLRDCLIEVEDRDAVVSLATADGQVLAGRIVAVGLDHLVLSDGYRDRVVAIAHIVTAETR